MSETWLDNNSVETTESVMSHVSGVSLGQCIKINAQDGPKFDSSIWHEELPEKNWHTLQGIVTSEITKVEDLGETSFTDDPSYDYTGSEVAVPPLLLPPHHSQHNNSHLDFTQAQNFPKLLSTDFDNEVSEGKNNLATQFQTQAPLRREQCDDKSVMLNILQNDDSLAQRVRDLLEEGSEVILSNREDDANESGKFSASKTSSVSHGDLCEKEPDNDDVKILTPPSSYEPLTDRKSLTADELASLNTSMGTEYGELPETIDIPKDILKHLENMRQLSDELKVKKAWPEETGKLNIEGGVGYHLGSKPTTPQFAVGEEKLNQLQTYIEKKTGLPVISPLVNEGIISTPSEQVPITQPKSANKSDQEFKEYLNSLQRNQVQLTKDHTSQPDSRNDSEHQSSTNVSENSNHYVDVERKEPEGMSPPILPVSTSYPIKHQKNRNGNESTSNQNISLQHSNSKHLQGNVLSDELLISRIRSVLSTSNQQLETSLVSPKKPSDLSFAESVDSLALQVKVLLQEELDASTRNDDNPHQTSNLSEVIENFENTELWKYVRQFLPGEEKSLNQSRNEGSFNQTTSGIDESMSEFNNSLLEKIREEFRKESELMRSTTPEKSPREKKAINTRVLASEDSIKTTGVPFPQQRIKFDSGTFVDKKITPSLLKPNLISENINSNTPVSKPHTNFDNYFVAPTHTEEKFSSHEAPLSKIGKQKTVYDSIPGIPDFRRSVYSPADENKNSSASHKFLDTTKSPKRYFSSERNTTFKQNLSTKQPVELDNGKNGEKRNEQNIRVLSFHTDDTDYSLISETDIQENKNNDQVYSDRDSNYFKQDSFHEINKSNNGNHSPSKTITSQKLITPRSSVNLPVMHSKKDLNPRNYYSYSDNNQNQPRKTPERSFPRHISNSSQLHWPKTEEKFYLKQLPQTSPTFPYQTSPKRRIVKSELVPSVAAGTGGFVKTDKASINGRSNLQLNTPNRSKFNQDQQISQRLGSRQQPVNTKVNLPTFDELMKQQETKEVRKSTSLSNAVKPDTEVGKVSSDLNLIPRLDKSSGQNIKSQNCTATGSNLRSTTQDQFVEINDKNKSSKKSAIQNNLGDSEENCSLKPQVPNSKSYQETTFLMASESDLEMQRRTISYHSTDTDCHSSVSNISMRSIPQTLSEFESLDNTSQKKVVKRILEWAKNKNYSTSKQQTKPQIALQHPNVTNCQQSSYSSNQAICDSDSTEYCELPSSRSISTRDEQENARSILGVDESKAERIMKRLLDKIEKQKQTSLEKKRKDYHMRLTSSTPQRVKRTQTSQDSTDTDISTVQVIQIPNKHHGGKKKKKIAFIEEDSDNSDPIFTNDKKTLTRRVIVLESPVQTKKKNRKAMRSVSTNFPSPERKKTIAIQTSTIQPDTLSKTANQDYKANRKMHDDKENVEHHRRVSSYIVNKNQKQKNPRITKKSHKKTKPVPKSLAWYEPYKYEPPWQMEKQVEVQPKGDNTVGLVQLSLQEALQSCLPDFVSKSRERQRKIQINSEERKMQAIWAEEREKVFGANQNFKQNNFVAPVLSRQRPERSRKQMVAETKEKYNQLPEVIYKKHEEARKREYSSNRLKAQLYQKKIQRQILGRRFNLF